MSEVLITGLNVVLTFATVVSGKHLSTTVIVKPYDIDNCIRTYKNYGWDLTGYCYEASR